MTATRARGSFEKGEAGYRNWGVTQYAPDVRTLRGGLELRSCGAVGSEEVVELESAGRRQAATVPVRRRSMG